MLSITVNSDGDAGAVDPTVSALTSEGTITLRSALEAVDKGLDTSIGFAGSYTIAPGAPLPAIMKNNVTINGGGSVVVDGSGVDANAYPHTDGLAIEATGCTIEGLTIQHFTGNGVTIDGTGSDLQTIVFDFASDFPALTINNQVLNNRLLDNGGDGLFINHASYNVADGNTIGGNGANGIEIDGSGYVIATTDVPFDTKQNQTSETMAVTSDAVGNQISGNLIGIDSSDEDIHNALAGVLIDGGCYNWIGGSNPGDGNTIAYNHGDGVRVTGTTTGPRPLLNVEPYDPPESAPPSGGGSSSGLLAAALDSASQALAAPKPPRAPGSNQPAGELSEPTSWGTRYTVVSIGSVPALNVIAGNSIGANTLLTATAGNVGSGVHIEPAARVTFIASNVIGGNQSDGVTIWLAPQAPAADPTAVEPYSVDVSQIASQLTSLSGWYVAATATYSFQDGTASMPSGAVTSMFSNIVTLS